MSHRASSYGLLAFVGFVALSIPQGQAFAADLDYGYSDAPPPVEQRVEFGSGWYIRGDIAATRGASVRTNDLPYHDVYSGPGTAAPTLSASQSNRPLYDGTIGGGYQFNKWFRADLTLDFHQPVKSSTTGATHPCVTGSYVNPNNPAQEIVQAGGCTPTLAASLRSFSVLANGYLDLGTWSLFTPYIGGGVGLSYGRAEASATYIQNNNYPYAGIQYTSALSGVTFTQDWDRSARVQYYQFAYALMGGVAIDIYDHTKLDIGYRYLSLGRVLGYDYKSQEIRAGLRYMIDN